MLDYIEKRIEKSDDRQILERFVAYLAAKKFSPFTIKNYMNIVFAMKKNFDIYEIDDKSFRMFLDEKAQERSGSICNQFIATMKHFHDFLVLIDIKEENIFNDVKYYPVPNYLFLRPKCIDFEDILAMAENPMVHITIRMAINLMFYCAMRANDVVNLRMNEIIEGLNDNTIYSFRSKAEVDVLCTYDDEFKALILEYLKWRESSNNPFFMLSKQRKRLKHSSLKIYVKEAVRLTFIDEPKLSRMLETVSCHAFRHSFATYADDLGMGVAWIRDRMGWTSSAMYDRYARYNKKRIAEKSKEFYEKIRRKRK